VDSARRWIAPRVSPHRWSLIAVALAALPSVALLVYFVLAPLRSVLVRFVPDDALFYLVVADNGVHGRWLSFDGLTRTNGFHPLWGALLHLVAFGVRGHPTLFVREVLVLAWLCNVGAAALLCRLAHRRGGLELAAVVAAMFAALVPAQGWYLTEAALAVLLAALFVTAAVEVDGARRGPLLGALAGLTVLARLDAAFVLLPALWAATPGPLRRRALAFAVSGAVLAPYLVANVALFGHLVPISGALKAGLGRETWAMLVAQPGRWTWLLPVVAIHGLALVLGPPARVVDRLPSIVRATAAGSLLFVAYDLCLQSDIAFGLFSWHIAVPSALAAFNAGVLAERLRRSALAVALASLACFQLATRLAGPPDVTLDDVYETAAWIHDHLPKGAVVAATDAGLVAYVGRHRTVNLDGLISNFDFQDVLRDRRLRDHLARAGVTHVCVVGRDRPSRYDVWPVSLPARLYGRGAGDTLLLRKRDELYVSPSGRAAIWRWRPN
jgi:hypothetical protein